MNQAFERIFIIFFENENASLVLDNPIFADYAKKGMLLTDYHGVTHPSQPNYIALFGGDFFGCTSDDCQDFDQTNLIDLLEENGVDWRAYEEDYLASEPLACSSGLYYRKHNPIVSFTDNQTPERLAKVVPATSFDPNNLPPFVWYGPNIQNCGHTVPGSSASGGSAINIGYAAIWLQGFLEPLLQNPTFMDGTLVVLTFDEDWPQVDFGQPETGDPIYTVLLGNMIPAGTTNDTPYNHYNLLSTIEKNFDLGNLGRNDQNAAPFDFLWDQ